MPDPEIVANFSNMDDLRFTVSAAADVPNEVWFALQRIHYESIRAGLPRDQWKRAARQVRNDDLEAYRDIRVDPNLLVGHGWTDHQIFRKPLVVVAYDRSNQPIGAVLTANNTSASIAKVKPFDLVECWAKMLTPPQIISKRHVHLREAYVHPDVQTALDTPDNVMEVSGITLAGLYHSLRRRRRSQKLVAYIVPEDPADMEFVRLTRAINMQSAEERAHHLPGFNPDAQLIRVHVPVGQVMAKIVEMPGARQALDK